MSNTRAGLAALLFCATAMSARATHAASPEYGKAYEAALSLHDAALYEEAIAAFGKAFALEPDPSALFMIARCHHKMKRYEAAAAAYEAFLRLAPPEHKGVPDARAYLVTALTALGEEKLDAAAFARARAVFERALAVGETTEPALGETASVRILAGLGEALAGLGEKAAAIETLKRAYASALLPDLRERIEKQLAALGAPVVAPESAHAVDLRAAGLVPDPAAWRLPAAKPRSAVPFYLGVGGGAGILLGGVATIIVYFAAQRRPGLGCFAVPAPSPGAMCE